MNISHCGNFDVSRQYLQYFAFCINTKSWEKFRFLYSVIDPLKKGITNMNKSKIRREIEINGISVISLTKMRIVEENFSFACVYDVFTIINGNEMSWFSNKHCIKYIRWYKFLLTRSLSYTIYDSDLIQENTAQWIPVFLHNLCRKAGTKCR